MLKEIAKLTLRLIATVAISPLLLSHLLFSSISNADRSLESHSQLLSLLPGISGNYLRLAFYRFTLDQCDPTATICFGTIFSKAGARIGKHVYVGPRCMLGLVTLHEDVLLGPSVQIPSGPNTHGTSSVNEPIRLQPGQLRRVSIGRDSWIGCNAIILEDQAEQTIIGAGSIATRKHDSRTVIAGNPATVIGRR